MADTSIKVYLGIRVTSTGLEQDVPVGGESGVTGSAVYRKLADITDFPDLIGDSEDIESTTMSSTQRTYESGLQGAPNESFTAQFDRATYLNLQTLQSSGQKYYFCLLISDSGSLFEWQGSVSVGLGGAGINEIISMPIKVTFSTQVTLNETQYEYKNTATSGQPEKYAIIPKSST